MKLTFYKYHGTGNDFILIDNREKLFNPGKKLIAWLCDRRFGVGADGLITLEMAAGYDFAMKYYNSDGNESSMCGNGGRCLVAFADFLSLTGDKSRFLATDGEHTGYILNRAGDEVLVKLGMNDVPSCHIINNDFILNTGSPHYVRFAQNILDIDVVKEGRAVRYSEDFLPDGINVNFAEYKDRQLFVRTYERGVEDETLSCGTGVTASALAYAALKDLKEATIPIMTRGGGLSLHFSRKGPGFSDIWLEGPAVKVFQGLIEIKPDSEDDL